MHYGSPHIARWLILGSITVSGPHYVKFAYDEDHSRRRTAHVRRLGNIIAANLHRLATGGGWF